MDIPAFEDCLLLRLLQLDPFAPEMGSADTNPQFAGNLSVRPAVRTECSRSVLQRMRMSHGADMVAHSYEENMCYIRSIRAVVYGYYLRIGCVRTGFKLRQPDNRFLYWA